MSNGIQYTYSLEKHILVSNNQLNYLYTLKLFKITITPLCQTINLYRKHRLTSGLVYSFLVSLVVCFCWIHLSTQNDYINCLLVPSALCRWMLSFTTAGWAPNRRMCLRLDQWRLGLSPVDLGHYNSIGWWFDFFPHMGWFAIWDHLDSFDDIRWHH